MGEENYSRKLSLHNELIQLLQLPWLKVSFYATQVQSYAFFKILLVVNFLSIADFHDI